VLTRPHFTIVSLAAGLVFAVAASAAAQTWGRPRVPQSGACFYEHINFEGRYFCYRSGSSNDNVPRGLNNEISSIRIFGNAQVVVYKDGDYRGASRHFESNVSDLRREGLNDRISSLRVDERRGGRGGGRGARGGGPSWGRPPVPRSGACFYQHINFGGDYFCASLGSRAEVPHGTNDEISSFRIFGDADVTVFRDVNYQGSSRRFDRDVRDLRRSGWNDRISSYSIDRRRGG
jgi:Beta/Gamma crystallin/Peptidase inhibitor family I36